MVIRLAISFLCDTSSLLFVSTFCSSFVLQVFRFLIVEFILPNLTFSSFLPRVLMFSMKVTRFVCGFGFVCERTS